MSHALFTPLVLGDVTIRNRIWVPPMCQYSVAARDGIATSWHLVHLGSLARGGAGAVIVEATAVVPEGRISAHDLGLWNDQQRDALAPIARFMREQGAVAGIQLAHAGRKVSAWPEWGAERTDGSVPLEEGGWETVGPSSLAFPGMRSPRALDQDGIDAVVAAFAEAARRAVDAGFELLEVHGAHGYLIHEFLSPLSNERDDSYGGSLENRARLLLQIVDAVRDEVGTGVALVVRLSATDWTEGGLTVEDTIAVARWLADHGVHLLDVSTAGNVPASIPVGPGYQTRFAAQIRDATGVPTGAVGLITDPEQAEHILVSGQADVVLIGREMMRNPHFAFEAARALRFPTPPVPNPYRRGLRHDFPSI